MRPVKFSCPECDSEFIESNSRHYKLYKCRMCGEVFSEDDLPLTDKSRRKRTRYEDLDDEEY